MLCFLWLIIKPLQISYKLNIIQGSAVFVDRIDIYIIDFILLSN